MLSAFHYREMARECMREANSTDNAARKKALQDIAKLYTQTANNMDAPDLPGRSPPIRKAE